MNIGPSETVGGLGNGVRDGGALGPRARTDDPASRASRSLRRRAAGWHRRERADSQRLDFTDPSTGEQHGYFDEWIDGVLHYAGEGQTGDQRFTNGNKAIRDHAANGYALRVFYGSKGVVEYAGEFVLDSTDPTYTRRHTPKDGVEREVIMFRLLPVGTTTTSPSGKPGRLLVKPALANPYKDVDPAKASAAPTDPFEVDPDKVDRGLRGHATTQQWLADRIRSGGLEPLSPGPGDPNFDVAWIDHHDVVHVAEVKSLTNANEDGQLRLGLGQVLHYRALLQQTGKTVQAVLALEREPRDPIWTTLATSLQVDICWPGQ